MCILPFSDSVFLFEPQYNEAQTGVYFGLTLVRNQTPFPLCLSAQSTSAQLASAQSALSICSLPCFQEISFYFQRELENLPVFCDRPYWFLIKVLGRKTLIKQEVFLFYQIGDLCRVEELKYTTWLCVRCLLHHINMHSGFANERITLMEKSRQTSIADVSQVWARGPNRQPAMHVFLCPW